MTDGSQRKRAFVPMRQSFFLLYASVIFTLLAFVANGIWFSHRVKGLSQAINLAGSERMRTFQIASLIARASDETSPARERTLGHVKMEMDRFEEILNALKDGSLKYELENVTDKEADAKLKELILEWEEVFKPHLNAILISAPEERKHLLSEYDYKIHDFVEVRINGLVVHLVQKMEHAERIFMSLRYTLTLLAVVLMGFNLLYLRRRILRPISVLMHDTEEVAKGNYAVRSEVATPNEFMLLAERFNAMTSAISTSFNTMEETIRMRTEELSASNLKMQGFFDSAPDAIISIRGEDRNIIFFSRGAEKMFGYGAEEVLGRNVSLLMPEPYHSNHEQYVKNYLETGVKKIIGIIRHEKARRKNGEIFEIDLSVSEVVSPAGRIFNGIIRDVSKMISALNETARIARHLQMLMDSTGEGVYGIDLEGRCTFINRSGAATLGYAVEELLGKNMHQIIHHSRPDGSPYPVAECPIYRAFLSGVAAHVDDEWLWRKDRTFLPVKYASYPMIVEGVIQGAVVTFNDISERVIVERKMIKLSNAVEQSEESIVITDIKGTIEYVNPAFERITGYSAAEAIGRNPRILRSGRQSKEFYEAMWKTILGGDIWHGEIINKKKNGELYYEQATLSPVKDEKGAITNIVAMKTDITTRILAEQEIEKKNLELESMARYDQAFARITSAFSSTFDQKLALGRMLSILAEHLPLPCSAFYSYDEWSDNLVCAAAYGVSDTLRQEIAPGEGIVGQSVTEKKAIVVADTEKFPMMIEAGVFTIKPHAVLVQPVFYQEKFVGVLVVASTAGLGDLDRSFMEKIAVNVGIAMQNLRQYGDLKDLSEQIEIRGAEISRKNLELEEANRLKSEFLANMSHELRTPLNAIIGFSEVLKDGVLGELTPDQTDYTKDIFTSGQHLLSLINDILDLSKIDAGKMTLDLEPLDIPALLENSLSVVKEKAMAHNIKLRLDIEEGVGSIAADARKVKQIVYNLLSNAVKFTPDGGSVSVAARRVPGVIARSVGDEAISKGEIAAPAALNDTLEISVTDTGIGISEEGLARLFKPFEQLDGSLSRKYEGTGLGLAMVRRLAELHGGTVAVLSEPGKGSCFTVRLPYRQDAATTAAPAEVRREKSPATPAAGACQPLVLIVEDDEKAADLMRVQLESEGYRTLPAPTAEEGLELAASRRPDLITMDIMLPGMDGWKFLEKIKADEDLADIPVIVVSMAADLNRGFSLGASKVLQKPVTREDLLSAVRDMGLSLKPAGGPLSVLVVDDDPKAVELVSKHFEREGCTVLRAYGGQESIDVALREKPDLMVLDLMMPDVTGFDVVNAVKARSETAGMTIIVLTAKIITAADRKALEGSVARIVQKGGFKGEDFIAEARRALGGRARMKKELQLPFPRGEGGAAEKELRGRSLT